MLLKSRKETYCDRCKMKVDAGKDAEHRKSKKHLFSVAMHMFMLKESEMLKPKEGVSTYHSGDPNNKGSLIPLSGSPKVEARVELAVHSSDYDVRLVNVIVLKTTDKIKVCPKDPNRKMPVTIRQGDTCLLEISSQMDQVADETIAVALAFSRAGIETFFLLRHVKLSCVDKLIEDMQSAEAIPKEQALPKLPDARVIVPINRKHTGLQFSTPAAPKSSGRRAARRRVRRDLPDSEDDSLQDDEHDAVPAYQKDQLRNYFPPNELRKLYTSNLVVPDDADSDLREFSDVITNTLTTGINSAKPENYDRYLQVLLHCEDLQQQADIRMYDKPSAELRPFPNDSERFELEVEGLQEGRPSLLAYDTIYIRKKDDCETEYEGIIAKVKARSIEIVMSDKFCQMYAEACADPETGDEASEELAKSLLFGVRFSVSRKVIRLMHRALAQVADRREKGEPLEEMLMPQSSWPARPAFTGPTSAIELVNKRIADNRQQFAAVVGVLRGLYRPAPFILFGPPGTGKTTTITEAVIQVYKLLPESKILITAPSNAAANVIAEKVHRSGSVAKGDMLRYYGMSCNKRKVPDVLEEISNWRASEDSCVEMLPEELTSYRILVCTLSTSGALVTMGIKPGHFTHLFIDEAGHAMECEALIPIAGLMKMYQNAQAGCSGCIILSGDHLQLGPIIRSPVGRIMDFGMSLLERLMNSRPYRRQANGSFNPMVLTKLVNNFRSHKRLLYIPNRLFYDEELKPCGLQDVTHAMVDYSELPEKGFPLIFHGVAGRELRDASNPSLYNPHEISIIAHYVKHLLSSQTFSKQPIKGEDIGVISPYRRQVLKIRQALEDTGVTDVTVGSTEEFQGQERLIILLSTVRSSNDAYDGLHGQTLGFLRNEKRFNVATTRAKALLIVVGDPRVLQRDRCWRTLMQYCKDMGGYRGEEYKSAMQLYHDMIEKLEELNIKLNLQNLSQRGLASCGRVAITNLTMEEDPIWTHED